MKAEGGEEEFTTKLARRGVDTKGTKGEEERVEFVGGR